VHVLSSLAISIIGVIVIGDIALLSAAMYLLPTLIGRLRRVPDLGSVAVINLLLGWTLIGWVSALAMALRSAAAPGAAVQIVNNLPAQRPPDGLSWAGYPDLYPYRQGFPPPLELPTRPAGPESVR
jgi:hypothetical protein